MYSFSAVTFSSFLSWTKQNILLLRIVSCGTSISVVLPPKMSYLRKLWQAITAPTENQQKNCQPVSRARVLSIDPPPTPQRKAFTAINQILTVSPSEAQSRQATRRFASPETVVLQQVIGREKRKASLELDRSPRRSQRGQQPRRTRDDEVYY